MIVYSYNPETLEFIGITEAFESPLEEGVFHIPANTTELAPPDFDPSTQTCKLFSGNWVIGVLTETPLPPGATAEEEAAALAVDLLNKRNGTLAATDWMILRHQDELLSGPETETTLASPQLKALLKYRQALRDITKLPGFPAVELSSMEW